MTRYFMTIPEAVSLVLQSGAMADQRKVFLLDMGEPVSILDLARQMIRLAGLRPDAGHRDRVHRAPSGRAHGGAAARRRRDPRARVITRRSRCSSRRSRSNGSSSTPIVEDSRRASPNCDDQAARAVCWSRSSTRKAFRASCGPRSIDAPQRAEEHRELEHRDRAKTRPSTGAADGRSALLGGRPAFDTDRCPSPGPPDRRSTG